MIQYFYEMYYYFKDLFGYVFNKNTPLIEYKTKENDEINEYNENYIKNLTNVQKNKINELKNIINNNYKFIDVNKMYSELKNINPQFNETTIIKKITVYLQNEIDYENSINNSDNLTLSVENIERNTFLRCLKNDFVTLENIKIREAELKKYIKETINLYANKH